MNMKHSTRDSLHSKTKNADMIISYVFCIHVDTLDIYLGGMANSLTFEPMFWGTSLRKKLRSDTQL